VERLHAAALPSEPYLVVEEMLFQEKQEKAGREGRIGEAPDDDRQKMVVARRRYVSKLLVVSYVSQQ
jgi:hypothetical protein